MEILKFNKICKYFGEVKALDDISFSVECGQWLSIMGQAAAVKARL